MFQVIEQNKTSEKYFNDVIILPDKELQVMVMKMLNNLGRRMNEQEPWYRFDTENIRNYQTGITEVTELKSAANELKKCTREIQQQIRWSKR